MYSTFQIKSVEDAPKILKILQENKYRSMRKINQETDFNYDVQRENDRFAISELSWYSKILEEFVTVLITSVSYKPHLKQLKSIYKDIRGCNYDSYDYCPSLIEDIDRPFEYVEDDEGNFVYLKNGEVKINTYFGLSRKQAEKLKDNPKEQQRVLIKKYREMTDKVLKIASSNEVKFYNTDIITFRVDDSETQLLKDLERLEA